MKTFTLNTLIFLVSAVNFVKSADDLNLNLICQGLLFNALPHPYNSNLFIGCVQGRGTIFGCENESDVFDSNETKCTDADSISSTTECSTSEGSTTERNGLITVRLNCPPTGNDFIPHRFDCTRYFECINGDAFARTCSTAGDQFDVISRKCLPPNMAVCADIIQCS